MNIVNLGYRSTNYYAVPLSVGMLLVDCGWPGTLPRFLAEFRRKDISPSDITYILATHFHPDHAGLVEDFKQRGTKLILVESQLPALVAPAAAGSTKMPAHIHISAENNVLLRFADSRRFLASLGLAGEIIPTPGHSDDSVTLILDDGSAFTGDLPPRFLMPDDNPVLRASWAEIDRHNVTRVYPSHGG